MMNFTRKVSFLIMVLVCVSCSHPIVIVGEGDVWSTGGRTCTFEDFQAGLDNCAKNYVFGDYQETYFAEPRAGWRFDRWENYCTNALVNACSFDVPASIVDQVPGETVPPLRAIFTPDQPRVIYKRVERYVNARTGYTFIVGGGGTCESPVESTVIEEGPVSADTLGVLATTVTGDNYCESGGGLDSSASAQGVYSGGSDAGIGFDLSARASSNRSNYNASGRAESEVIFTLTEELHVAISFYHIGATASLSLRRCSAGSQDCSSGTNVDLGIDVNADGNQSFADELPAADYRLYVRASTGASTPGTSNASDVTVRVDFGAASIVVNNREWLQPDTFAVNGELGAVLTWDDFHAVCPNGLCPVGAMLEGVELTGWTWATADDVNALFNHYIGRQELGPGPDGYSEVDAPWVRAMEIDGWRAAFDGELTGGFVRFGTAAWTSSPAGANDAYFADIDEESNAFEGPYTSSATTAWSRSKTLPGFGAWFYRDLP